MGIPPTEIAFRTKGIRPAPVVMPERALCLVDCEGWGWDDHD